MPMSAASRLLTRRGIVAGVAAGAAAISLRALGRPLPDTGERRLLDWETVRRTAHSRTGEGGPSGVPDAARLAAAYDAVAAELAPLIAEVSRSAVAGYPHVSVLDRRGFIDANLVIVRRLFEPIEQLRAQLPESRFTAASRGVLSRYLGELLGFLSRRVLGQYDPVLLLLPPAASADGVAVPALSLVEPNIAAFEARQRLPGLGLRRWLVLHELTHAWQFESHPWLGEHLAATMRELLMNDLVTRAAAPGRSGSPGPPSLELLRGTPQALRAQLRAVGRLQAVMSVCEGYCNYVMHRVGATHVEDFARLERGFHERQSQRSLLERLVLTVTGLNMKLRQYELGERFAEAVVTHGGLELLNRVWDGPRAMPTLAELRQPERWMARVG